MRHPKKLDEFFLVALVASIYLPFRHTIMQLPAMDVWMIITLMKITIATGSRIIHHCYNLAANSTSSSEPEPESDSDSEYVSTIASAPIQ